MRASRVPAQRIARCNEQPVRRDGAWVLYWMIAQRRRRANFALQRAVEWCRELELPLCVLEALRCDYRWASDRLHRFVLDGMRDNATAFADVATYHPYVEPAVGAGKGLLAALAARAAVVVTDEFPCFFLPRMVAAAARRLPVLLEQVDGNGLLPLRAADRPFLRAVDFRRFLQRELAAHLRAFPAVDPLRAALPAPVPLPRAVLRRWPRASRALLQGAPAALRALPVDHDVAPVATPGGAVAAAARLRAFVRRRLGHYGSRSDPDADAASGLSPYLHFGHLSAHEVFAALARRARWTPARLRPGASGKRGWFGMDAPGEAFLDQLVTWRELGYQAHHWAAHRGAGRQGADPADYGSLPEWARRTLAAHAHDPRDHVYRLPAFARAATHDALWNAAQRQLLQQGTIHNYLRMLWGKKVLEWTRHPEEAWAILVELNNRYALDGRNPNSYSGIGWVFGRYDRPWAPQRPVFGAIRFMSSQNTVRKLHLAGWLRQFGG
jgi:deoxyribodipyrimidine photo-lyase